MCECCGGDCKLCGGEMVVKKVCDMSRVEERLNMILEDEIFETKDMSDGLRIKFACIRDNLWDIMRILKAEEGL